MENIVQIHINEDVAGLIDNNKPEQSVSFWFALGLYLSGKISLAKAANLAGMDRFTFEKHLAKLELPINLLSDKEIEEELDLIDNIR